MVDESLRILILEDRPADVELIQFELQEAGLAFTARVVMEEKDFVRELQEFSPDLILSDYDLPTYNGALALAEAKNRCPDTPFILVTGAIIEDRAIEILTKGAKDYVLKTRLQQRLAPAVKRALAEAEELRARKRAEAGLREAHRSLEERVKIRTAELEAEMTARKKTAEALREAYGRITAILESIADAFYSLDDQWRFVAVNPAAERAPFGQPASELLGKVIWDVFPAIVGTRIHQHYLDAAERRSQEHYEAQSPLNGRWYEVFMFPREKGLDIYLRDIDDRKKVEEKLLENEEQFRTLANSIPNLAWWANGDGYITWYNQRWYEYTGTTPEQMEGWGWQSVHDPKVLPSVLERWIASIATGKSFEMEFPLRGADGIFRSFLTRVLPLKDSAGQVLRWFGTNTDISSLMQAEEALRDSEKRYRRLFEASKDGILILDAYTGKVEDVNPFLLQLLGYSYDAIRGKYIWELGVFKDIVASKDAFKVLQENEYIRYDDLPLETRNGQSVAVEFVSNVYLVDHHKVIQCNIRDITAQKQVKDEKERIQNNLQIEKERLQALINSITDEIWFADTQKQFTLANPSALKEFGLNSDAEIIDIRKFAESLEVYRPDGSPRSVEEAPPLRALRGEVVRNQEEMIRTPGSGEFRHRQVSSNPVKNASGQIIGSVSVVRDITEQKLAGEKLHDSEKRYRTLFDSMTEGFAIHEIITDEQDTPVDYRFLDINPAFERLTGLKREDVVGKTHNEVLHDNDPMWLRKCGVVALTGEPVQFENYSPALKRYYEVLAYRPAPRQFAVIFMDISERKQKEKDQEKFNRTLRALNKSDQAMMRAIDERSYMEEICKIVVEDCGHAMVWIGFAEDDESKTVRPVAYNGFEQGYIDTLKITWANTERGRGPTGIAIREGSIKTCRNMLTDPLFKPWREEALKRGYASSIVLPLMSDNKAFGALTIYSKEPDSFIEDEVKILTELANDLSYAIMSIRLRAARMKAEEALNERTIQLENSNKELESFSYSVSHDLRAPLRTIAGYARMILKKEGNRFDEDTRNKFNVISSSVQNMNQLIDDLLNFSRLVRLDLAISKMDMEGLIRDTWQELKHENADRVMMLKIGKLPQCMGDRNLMKQVYINLLSNAAKFTRLRDTALIETGGYLEGNECIYFVKDNGTGFDMAYHDKLFGVFQRLHSSDEYEGTGIGLALVKRIINRHGGRIWAEGKVNEGATFFFSLPQHTQEQKRHSERD